MKYFDEYAYKRDQQDFEKTVINNYYIIDWVRLTGLRWDDRPEQLKELHRAFERLHMQFPLDDTQANEYRAQMERIINALKIEYDKLTNN